ncbi:hypothetical protein LTV02_07825 [Nocardia yamanashiensis]|uniref:hypothetical protein n=1 Tax=Nocardia yamanashiensis TaxID=209247 RepID=UPI001E3763A9|nr:hypothetical protein [Nocardia yamanashiensis]UGT43285.1 hypothetical protein LTV02_07825 [Nocardia yamanashiensis]
MAFTVILRLGDPVRWRLHNLDLPQPGSVDELDEFLREADDGALDTNRKQVLAGIRSIARNSPEAALRLLSKLSRRRMVPREVIRDVVGSWLRSPEHEEFESAWSIADELLRDSTLQVWMREQIRAGPPVVSPTFGQLVRRHLAAQVDQRFDWYMQNGASVWQVLFASGPTSRPEWYCALGDYALLRGDSVGARRRYSLARQYGSSGARDRLARWTDLMSYLRLLRDEFDPEAAGSGNYQRLLQYADCVTRDLPARNLEVVTSENADYWRAATFVVALRHLRADNPFSACVELRRITGKSTRSTGDRVIDASARILFGALESDDRLITSGARVLFFRYGDRWPAYSIVDPRVVLVAVARSAPAMLEGSTAAALRVATAHRSLARAMAVLSQEKQVRARLLEAQRLLDGLSGESADRLRRIGDRITEVIAHRDRQHLDRTPDILAYAALESVGVRHPWSAAAELMWHSQNSFGSGERWSLHHLAITLHARAYQLESDSDDRAFEYWRYALAGWSRLLGDEEFWKGLRVHLTRVLAADAVGDVDDAIAAARAELPAQVLEPHATRIHQLRGKHPQRAHAHCEIILQAPLPAEARRQVIDSLIGVAVVQVGQLAHDKNWDRALIEAQQWMSVDPTSFRLAELLLETSNDYLRALPNGPGWVALARPVLDGVGLQSRSAVRRLDLVDEPPPEVDTDDRRACVAALAKHEFWLGWLCWQVAGELLAEQANGTPGRLAECLGGFLAAEAHFSRALSLGLPATSPYDRTLTLRQGIGKTAVGLREVVTRPA